MFSAMHLFPPTSVLVIESHPMMREALCNAIVAEADFCIAEPVFDAAQTSWMAIAAEPDTILLAYKPDIILLALGNPGTNEMGTLESLRKSLPETPILALTTNEVEGQERAALEAGARMVLTKAAPRTELIRQLREIRTQAFMNFSTVYPKMEENEKIYQ
jgi:DNA-binding NarL/FixJ family response regulator